MATDADKDRRSRMAISTVHAPPKKGGAGGHFTWGSATDTSMDFDAPRGHLACHKYTQLSYNYHI